MSGGFAKGGPRSEPSPRERHGRGGERGRLRAQDARAERRRGHKGFAEVWLSGENDFLSVATHEVTHLFGFGTSEAWNIHVVGATHTFDGPASVALYRIP